ncbi:MAG: RnfABCDGE type electron transport complex subunit G [Bacteroidales bacterium]|nr:RnfABCDGE type electron transport complex subunit G [Bacteroidales bacterium]
MAAQSTLKNMVLCLTAVCLVCAAVLGCVYAVTFQPIKDAAAKAQMEAIGKVLPEGVEISGEQSVEIDGTQYSYYVASADSVTVGYAVKVSAGGFGGPVELMAGVLCDGTIFNTSVLHADGETPGLGAKCTTDPAFVSQWSGFAADKKLAVTKDGGDVDAITAATITSRAYTKAVAAARSVALYLGGQCNE